MNWRKDIRRPNKYRARRTPCAWGHVHASGDEAAYCNELHLRHRAGDPQVATIKQQVRFPLVVNGCQIAALVVDFVTTAANGAETVREVKGVQTKDWKVKWKLFGALEPGLRKVVIHKGKEIKC